MAPILLTYKRRRSEMMMKMVSEQAIALSTQPLTSVKRLRVDENDAGLESSNSHDAHAPLERLPAELFLPRPFIRRTSFDNSSSADSSEPILSGHGDGDR